jgi:hypothetical protein
MRPPPHVLEHVDHSPQTFISQFTGAGGEDEDGVPVVLSGESGVDPREPSVDEGDPENAAGVPLGLPAAPELPAAPGLPAAPELPAGAGLVTQSIPKSGHATPDPQTPKMVPTTTRIQQTTAAMMTPVLTIVILKQIIPYYTNEDHLLYARSLVLS